MSPRRKQQHRMQHNVSLPAWSDAPELVKDGVLHVSIHVPAWGATTEFLAMRLPTMFQSTLPRGERPDVPNAPLMARVSFNPRSRVGSDGAKQYNPSRRGSFNPRSRVGSDIREQAEEIGRLRVSIHAPAWGATKDPAE